MSDVVHRRHPDRVHVYCRSKQRLRASDHEGAVSCRICRQSFKPRELASRRRLRKKKGQSPDGALANV